MNYWIFIVTDRKLGMKTYIAEEIYTQRMKDRFWGIGQKTPNRRSLNTGDKIVFYMGLPKKAFVGTAELATPCIELDENQKGNYAHGQELYMNDMGVLLKDVDAWSNPKPTEELVPQLNFIENKEYWYSYFQGGVRQVTEEDFQAIIGGREATLIEQIETTKDLESQSEFALESHLEEFLYQNWKSINWGAKLELYKTDDQEGRQFPAGTWNIDFLARDKGNNDLVVIELKRGKTSDATVGQVLRYIHWVKENIASESQKVRGIIIAKEVDEALKYSVRYLDLCQ